jgi:ABC-type nitrate/sulfonate/bicarbonate transport system ATPase subunit
MQMVAGFIASAAEVDVPQVDTPTESNIAFAGRTTEAGNLAFQIVMPKAHLIETKSVFENVIQKIKEQERLKRQKQKEKAQANNM